MPKPRGRERGAGSRARCRRQRAATRCCAIVLANAIPADALAEHVYVAAALQVHFARLAARLDADALVPVGDGACPGCGGPPVASMVVGWRGAHGSRFCACALCGTPWNYVRIKCVLCGSTKGIGYQGIEGERARVKAETCDDCRAYVKVLHQNKDTRLEPFADDVASLGARPAAARGRLAPRRRSTLPARLLRTPVTAPDCAASRLRACLQSMRCCSAPRARRRSQRFGRQRHDASSPRERWTRRAAAWPRGGQPLPSPSVAAADALAQLEAAARSIAHAPGLQPDRHSAAHQSRPRAAR